MKYNHLIIPALLFITSCNNAIGGGSSYRSISGKATITEIKNINDATCPDSVQVYFDFKPNNADDIKTYKFPNFPDTHAPLYSNHYPSRAWVVRKNIKIGDIYTANREEIITGTSTPYSFNIVDKNVYPYQERNPDGTYQDICK